MGEREAERVVAWVDPRCDALGEPSLRSALERLPDLELDDRRARARVVVVPAEELVNPEPEVVCIAVTGGTSPDDLVSAGRFADHLLIWPADADRLPVIARMARRAGARRVVEALYRKAVRNSPVWTELTWPDVSLIDVSRGFERSTGYSRDEVLGFTPAQLFRGGTHPREFYQDLIRALEEQGEWRGDMLARRRDGSLAVVDAHMVDLWRDGEVVARIAYKSEQARYRPGSLLAWARQRGLGAWLLVRRADGVVLEGGGELDAYLGRSLSELLGETCPLPAELLVGPGESATSDLWVGNRALEVDRAGRHVGQVDVVHLRLRDVTERKAEAETLDQMAQTLALARDQAMAANQAKSAFLAAMSHELRTPLNAIIGYSELVSEDLESSLPEEQLSVVTDLARVQSAGQHLLALVDDVLDLARIESGHVDIETERVSVRPMLEEVRAALEIRARQSGHHIEIVCEVGELELDRVRVVQILTNLLSNAVKYADPGRVVLGAEPARLYVEDCGPGLDPAAQQAIFEPFHRLQSGGDGVGLGLAMSRRLAWAIGGDLTVTSTLGQGSRFSLSL